MTMQSRHEALQRLVTLYGLVEEMHSVELQRVAAAVRRTQHSINEESSLEVSARNEGRLALCAGDRLSWWMAETQRDAAEQRTELLEKKRIEGMTLQAAAMEHYAASRMRREQIKRLQDDVAQNIESEERRRAQAISDDLFLARRRWTDHRERRHTRE